MGIIRPATPGFLVTLVATVLLAVVSFCVPYFKSIFFLKASITVNNISGNITFGTLGYCLELSNGTTCSKPSIGYELDINGLVGNKLPIEIPQVVVKWLTYALFLHVIALIGAAGSAVFGLLAHVREMSMACCSTFISGFAAVVAMLAFIFDLVLFFVAKARISKVGTAQMGNAIWLTLAAWLLLFFSGCFYSLGRCCIQNRPRAPGGHSKYGSNKDPEAVPGPNKDYTEQLRLDAVKAEADRKARQKTAEVGLPAFGSETQPLTGRVEGDHVYLDGEEHGSQTHLTASAVPPARQQGYAGGYVQGAPGSRAMDDYYSPQTPSNNTYPPQNLHRQPSGYAPSTYTANVPHSPPPQHAAGYGASPYAYNAPLTTSPPPSDQLLAIPGQYPQDQYGREYGHSASGTSYHTASSHHEQQASSYSQYDPYAAHSPPQQPAHYAEPSYNPSYAASHNQYYNTSSSPPPQQYQNERSYTLGGDGYGANSVPPLQEHDGYYGSQAQPTINTNVGYAHSGQTSPVRGPRAQPRTIPEDSPPGYEPGASGVTGNWGKR
ncbi:hypothetical protein GALMADRAFT_84706 [Galerina marginata CBS 339.88]|uniref:Pali-domain-containing protein n=1 Tax=Galerina marginata (strain CBS 339.88) TaxID=685588 RepID=A0A067TTK5_GALM3|nr:hypothetical protein GALMADRAFT_84706 [Galerina marginata CBS 339.88]